MNALTFMDRRTVYANVLAKYKDKENSHLDDLSITELCEYRHTVSRQLKSLEEERREIDEQIMESISEVELTHGINLKSGGCLKLKSRSNWKYPEDLSIKISELRRHCRESGEAFSETTQYLVIVST